MVVVLRDKVVALAQALDFKAAGSWNKATMKEKLPKIARVAKEDGTKVDDPELQALLDVLVEEGGVVEIAKDEEDLREKMARLEGVQRAVAEDAAQDAERQAEVAEAEARGEADETESAKAEEPKTEKPARAKKEKAEKPPKAPKPAKEHAYSYMQAVRDALAEGGTRKELVARVHALYNEHGREGDEKQAERNLDTALRALLVFGAVVEQESGRLEINPKLS